MNRKSLSVEDRRAVDLILNDGAAHRSGPSAVSAGASQARLGATTRLLSLLDTLPAVDPPDDLIARTMSRIDAAPRPMATAPAMTVAAAMH